MILSSKDKGALPLRTDPAARPLLEKLSDTTAVFGTLSYRKDDVPAIMAICERNMFFVGAYALALLPVDRSKLTQSQVLGAVQRSIQVYQDEISPLMAFAMVCNAKSMKPISEFLHSLKPEELTDVRRQGVKQAQLGIFQSIAGALITLNDQTINPANRLLLIRTAADNAGELMPSMSLEQRNQILLLAQEAKGASKEETQAIDVIRQQAGDEECSGLCTF